MAKKCCKEMWDKISEDEPVFILRGQDVLSAEVVETWIVAAIKNGVNSEKIKAAIDHLRDIESFYRTHSLKCKIPD